LPKNERKYIGSVKGLVPVDGSPASLRALDFAIEMTGQNSDTSLVLLNVQNISAMDLAGAAMGSDWQEAASEASTKALKEAVGKAEEAGIGFKSIVRTGQTAETIRPGSSRRRRRAYRDGNARPR
jgi:nucleotide-binding universal stress UspA family protein